MSLLVCLVCQWEMNSDPLYVGILLDTECVLTRCGMKHMFNSPIEWRNSALADLHVKTLCAIQFAIAEFIRVRFADHRRHEFVYTSTDGKPVLATESAAVLQMLSNGLCTTRKIKGALFVLFGVPADEMQRRGWNTRGPTHEFVVSSMTTIAVQARLLPSTDALEEPHALVEYHMPSAHRTETLGRLERIQEARKHAAAHTTGAIAPSRPRLRLAVFEDPDADADHAPVTMDHAAPLRINAERPRSPFQRPHHVVRSLDTTPTLADVQDTTTFVGDADTNIRSPEPAVVADVSVDGETPTSRKRDDEPGRWRGARNSRRVVGTVQRGPTLKPPEPRPAGNETRD
jgi:hypothetical protein